MPVEIVRTEQGGADVIHATLVDISQSGALIIAPTAIPAGEWIVLRPDQKGAGFGVEITAIVDHNLTPGGPTAKLTCRFPQPVDYSVLRLFR